MLNNKKIGKRLEEVILFLILSLMAAIVMAIFILSFFPPDILIYPERLNYGLISGGPKTGNQLVSLEFKNKWTGAKADLNWVIYSKDYWLEIKPKAGKGKALLNIGVRNIALKRKIYESNLVIYVPYSSHQKKTIKVRLSVFEPDKTGPPFGWMDLPLEGERISSQEILIAGWALDDLEVEKVLVKREPLAGEKVLSLDEEGLINLSEAPLLAGIRPDIEKLHPNLPFNYRASWGVRWELKRIIDLIKSTHIKLSSEEDVPIKLYAIFKDKEGKKTVIGPRTIFLKLEKWK